MRKTWLLAVTLCLAASLVAPSMAAAEGAMTQAEWAHEKCVRYAKAWKTILPGFGKDRLGEEFVTNHDAFLASDCTLQANVCPRSVAEFEIADILSLAALNSGITGSFMPFACRD